MVWMQGELAQVEVTVIGGGLAGMAASLHLAKAGLDVMCIEPDSEISKAVGESLDWSSPELLGSLGFPMARLIGEGIATYKRHVTVNLDDGCTRQYVPSDWLGRRPFHIELRTLHVDRLRLHRELRAVILSHGVRLLRDRVADVERVGRRVVSVTTAQGDRICSPFFIDASGAATSLFPRAFNLPFCEYGPQKVAVWNHFDVRESIEGTTLYTFLARNQVRDLMIETGVLDKKLEFSEYTDTRFSDKASIATPWRYEPGTPTAR
jgi:menaquinone-9 beta-reductase